MIILASGSPRRSKILKDAGVEFEIEVSQVDENSIDVEGLSPAEKVMKIATHKALDVAKNHKDKIIIGADTGVFLGSEFFGKPKDEEDAVKMLKRLSGKTHDVLTGVAVIKGDIIDTFYGQSKVTIRKLNEIEIKDYVNTKEPLDKAGAYAIQDLGGALVEKYEGDFFNIVGLPLKEVLTVLLKYN